jgi:transposase InsO family protein
MWVFFVFDKSEVQGKVKTFIRRAQSEFELTIKKVRSDNGSEFRNTNVEEFLDEEGIKHEFSAPYTPQQNRVVERKNRTLIEMAKIMLDSRHLLGRSYQPPLPSQVSQDLLSTYHRKHLRGDNYRLYLHKFHKTSPEVAAW